MITFVLPLSSSRDINIAINILFPSITTFFELKSLKNLIIILNKKDIDIFNYYIYKSNIDYINVLNINIIDEIDLINKTDLINKNVLNTYYLQMLLKILVCNNIDTDYYLTLDSDCLFTKKCSSSNFYSTGDGKAFYQKINIKDKWLNRVNVELNTDLDFNTNQTPFVFKTTLVNNMINSIDVSNLILNKNCSEYALYLGYLIKNKLFFDNYKHFNFTAPIINNNIVNNDKEDIEIKLNEAFLVNDNHVITCIQSRTNQLNNLLEVINMYIENITYKKNKIGLLTVISNDKYFKRYEEALFIKKDYCKYHNYDFIIKLLDYCDGWDKLKLLYEKLNEDYDYIFTSDADVVITNRDIMIDDIILKYSDDNTMMIITEDYNSLNSGNIIWKNCEETKLFLKKVLDVTTNIRYTLNEPFKSIGIYEQPSLIYIINKEYEYYKNKIKIIPQYEINSYMPIICKKERKYRDKWEPNDFLIHFAGFNYDKDKELTDKIKLDLIIKKFCTIYKIKIIQKEGNDYGNIK